MEKRGTVETAFKCHAYCSSIFRYAVANRRADRNPCADFRPSDAVGTIPKRTHFAALTDPEELGQYLRDVDGYKARREQVRIQLQMLPHVFVRPSDLRLMRWEDLEIGRARWKIPIKKGKVESLIVPLSSQALGMIEEARAHKHGDVHVFAAPWGRNTAKPLSDNTINTAMRRMGWEADQVTGHGFRATARTLLEEELGYHAKYIEMQLAHVVRDANGTAYNRTKFLKERTTMMQAWSDYLDDLKR